MADFTPRSIVERHVARIVVHAGRLVITSKPSANANWEAIELPWRAGDKRDLAQIDEGNASANHRSPNPQLVQALVRAHVWLKSLTDGTHDSIEALATAIDMHPKAVRNRIRLAFLAPTITEAILQGEQPPNFDLSDLNQAIPFSWNEQRAGVGVRKPSCMGC